MLVSIFHVISFAQKNVVKTSLLGPIIKTGSLSYERILGEKSSLQLGFLYTGAKIYGVKFNGFAVTTDFRYYLSKTRAPDGLYLGAFVRYIDVDLDEEATNTSGMLQSFGGGVVVGRQWIFMERISLDIFVGPEYIPGEIDAVSGDSGELQISGSFGLLPRFGLNLGLVF